MFSLFAVALNYWIRFHYLNDYTQLKEVPLGKPDATELHPDANTGTSSTNIGFDRDIDTHNIRSPSNISQLLG